MKTTIKNGFFLLLANCFLLACSTEMEPIYFGEDSCNYCKMLIMDTKFGAEIVTHKGKVYKFDDLNCLVQFVERGHVAEEDIYKEWVVDFGQPSTLVPAESAFFCSSDQIRSPMASQTAAFAKESDYATWKTTWQGEGLSWAEIKSLFSYE